MNIMLKIDAKETDKRIKEIAKNQNNFKEVKPNEENLQR